jgi:hypothetical protein
MIVAAAVVAIAGSIFWIYRTEFVSADLNVPLHQAVGRTLAEETARVVGRVGRVTVITMDSHRAPELRIQLQAFEKSLKGLGGITIKDKVVLDPGDNPKFRPGAGLSAKRFLKIARKRSGVDAIISFVGVPEVTDEELAQLKTAPRVIAETHSPERLMNLLDKKVLLVAVVPRFEFPAPGPRKPQTSRQWFDRYFQILAPGSALPKPDDSP